MSLLPAGYEALEPFCARWVAASSAERAALRSNSSADERQAFYDAASARVKDALALLDSKPLAELDEREQRLMQLLLSLAHVALSVELLGDSDADHARARQHLRITRSPAAAAA